MKTLSEFALLLLALFLISGELQAHDHINLERGIPVQIEDAYPTSYMNRELQGITRYERTTGDSNRYVLVPVLEYGFIKNGELEVEAPFLLGPAPDQGSGDIDVSALYNFFYEGLVIPAVSLSGTVTAPTGKASQGVDTVASLILTKTLSRSTFFHRLHFNARWYHNGLARTEQRESRYEFALAYQARLDPNNQLLLNVLRRQELERNAETNLIEAGLRHQWNPLTVLAAGIGVGVGPDSPTITGTLSFQRALNFFYDSPK